VSTQVQNTSQMRELRLTAMAQGYELQVEQPKLHQLAFDDRLGLLLEAEVAARKSRKLNRLVKVATFPETASLEDLDLRASRGLDKAFVASLSTCSWISRRQNLIIVGATGLGKSWLASALGQQACRLGMFVSFHRGWRQAVGKASSNRRRLGRSRFSEGGPKPVRTISDARSRSATSQT